MSENFKIGYHRTSGTAAANIMNYKFNLGQSGWFGAGIYFAESFGDTKGKAQHGNHGGNVLECQVNMGRVMETYEIYPHQFLISPFSVFFSYLTHFPVVTFAL